MLGAEMWTCNREFPQSLIIDRLSSKFLQCIAHQCHRDHGHREKPDSFCVSVGIILKILIKIFEGVPG
jgi:hypothetical protein